MDDYYDAGNLIGVAQIGTLEGNAEITQWWNELLNDIASIIQHSVQEFPYVWDDLERCGLGQNITTSLHWAMFGQLSTELRSTLGQFSVELRSKRRRGGWLPRR